MTKKELLVLMEIHWRESTIIKFHTLISPENYNKLDAATAFRYCLGKLYYFFFKHTEDFQ